MTTQQDNIRQKKAKKSSIMDLENFATKMNNLGNLSFQNSVKNSDGTPGTEGKQQQLPYDIFAEQILLGVIIANNEFLSSVTEFLKPEHFYDTMHQKIFRSMNTLSDKGIGIHHVSLHQQLAADPILEQLKADNYLLNLTTLAASTFNPTDYAYIVYDLAMRRELISIAHSMMNSALSSGLDHDAVQQIEAAESSLFNLVTEGTVNKTFITLKSSIDKSLAHINMCMSRKDSLTGITSGFVDLDDLLAGFHNSDLVILAARPGMGKTTLALNLAFNAAQTLFDKNPQKQKSVGIFSLEMHSEQLSTKLMAMEGNIDSSKILSGKLSEAEYNKLRGSAGRISELPIFIDDTPALSISAIRTRARRLKRKNNLGILFIDYLQLIQPSRNQNNRVLEISEITQNLKALAKELEIPVIALSQLSRAVESRTDKRPLLSDLRESGSIEQDADIVMFIYREEYYSSLKDEERAEEIKNMAEILIAKHRNGRTGIVKLYFNPSSSQFRNLSKA